LIGAAFLTKYLQAYLVLPGFALAWLVSAPVSLRRRLIGLAASAATVALTSLWWVAIVELIPSGSRPYIGGSTTNSPLELLLGYDGLGRIFGNQPGGSGLGSAVDGLAFGATPRGGGPTFSGTPGLFRLFNDQFGGQIAWLIPAALLALGVGIALRLRAGRTDRRFAGYLLWGTWLAVHVVVFNFMSGIIHTYYAVILAPAIAALVGGATVELWRGRATDPRAGVVLGVGVAMTGLMGFAILERTPGFAPGLAYGVLALSVAAALLVAIPAGLLSARVPRVALALAAAAVLAGPLAYAADSMATAYSGGDPSAGPQAAASIGGPGGNGPSGLRAGAATDQALVDYLVMNQGSARWIVAASGSQVAADIQLAAGLPVLTMGGFTGSDPAPTLAELEALVSAGQVRYVLLGGGPGGGPRGGPGGLPGFRGPGGSGGTDDRAAWVSANCAAVSAAGVSASGLYDCSGATTG
jgi:4-amino-4-deoxy-L-arabinose transferase-like glycosyltransferase